ncbi:fatty-acyl-CoA synthase [Tistlia consotensis]|uniref:Fatty-acyl-CoA synthase n=1 Tax=Tistlia consotensis USBA 355 TaxID=560819 RepID=A0A1Y6BV06_9PROT|nr:AMP-binding protein [Tistlia consotensis]SMF30117.1 fatty-acyl-CoA synthase [Tistlia consotensis USBA 355]SNR90437.1 fatty-acyl-CoA synthase [Tistlia consotensis]
MAEVRDTSDSLSVLAAAAAGRGPSVPELLAERRTAGAALIYEGRRISFAELDERARRVAAGLAALGVGEGDRVAVWLPNVPAYLEVFVACCHLGAICVAVNTRFRSVEVGDIVGRTGASALVFWPGFKGIDFPGILRGVDAAALGALRHIVTLGDPAGAEHIAQAETRSYDWLAGHAPLAESRGRPESPCKIFTTSGTTSGPKFVLHNQATATRHGGDVARAFGFDADDAVLLQVVPLCGVFGFAQIMGGLASGRPSVLLPAFDAAEAARLIREHRITHTNGADDMLDRLVREGEGGEAGARPFPSLRLFGYAKFNPALADVVERAEAAGITAVGVYGMSECMALFSFQPPGADSARRKLGGGIPVSPEAEVRVRDRDSGRLLPPGENGEIEIRAPSVMIGYFGNEAATRATFTEDWFLKTGDLGSLTDDGGFIYLARMGDSLRLGGFLVNPQEIETHLLTHPAVDGCQVVGVVHGDRTRAVAFVTLQPGAEATEAELIGHCEGRLARFKVPLRVLPVADFPVTQGANGVKVQRGRLREMAQAEVDRMPQGVG